MDFSRTGDLVKMGEAAARESLGKISSSLPLYRRIARFAGQFIKEGKKVCNAACLLPVPILTPVCFSSLSLRRVLVGFPVKRNGICC